MSSELDASFKHIEGKSFIVPNTTLVVATHPDDADIYAGGFVSALTSIGKDVHYLVCSNGNVGTWDEDMTQEQLVQLRIEEQRKAADILGVADVEFLGIDDGFARQSDEYLKKIITKKIRTTKPDLIITHDPWKAYDFHDDHRVVGFATAHATLLACNRLYYPDQLTEQIKTHFTPLVAFFNTDRPNFWVDLTEHYERKAQSVSVHETQFGTRDDFLDFLKDEAEKNGIQINKPYGETHHLIFNS